MPISPDAARALANGLKKLYEQIDDKIIADYISIPTRRSVTVSLSEAQYNSKAIKDRIRSDYNSWNVDFKQEDMCSPAEWNRGEGYYSYSLVLTER